MELLCHTDRFAQLQKTQGDEFSHLRCAKDVFEIHLKANPQAKKQDDPPFVCPITGLETNGLHQFVALPECGHTFAEKALAGIAATQHPICPICTKPYEKDTLVFLNPINDDSYELNKKRMLARPQPEKKKKHHKKRVRTDLDESEDQPESSATTPAAPAEQIPEDNNRKRPHPEGDVETEAKRLKTASS